MSYPLASLRMVTGTPKFKHRFISTRATPVATLDGIGQGKRNPVARLTTTRMHVLPLLDVGFLSTCDNRKTTCRCVCRQQAFTNKSGTQQLDGPGDSGVPICDVHQRQHISTKGPRTASQRRRLIRCTPQGTVGAKTIRSSFLVPRARFSYNSRVNRVSKFVDHLHPHQGWDILQRLPGGVEDKCSGMPADVQSSTVFDSCRVSGWRDLDLARECALAEPFPFP